MNNVLRQDFLKTIKDAFDAYNKYGARSNKKLIPIHTFFAKIIMSNLGNKYSVKSLGFDGEYKIEGKYYPKRQDITIFVNKPKPKPITTISLKFVTSNYAQNANNYFEGLLGETANIRRVGVGFAHFLILRGHTPYYLKAAGGERGELKDIEILSEHHIEKYVKLFKDLDFPHKPDLLGLIIVDFDEDDNPFFCDLKGLELKEETIDILENEFSIETFIGKFILLCKLKS